MHPLNLLRYAPVGAAKTFRRGRRAEAQVMGWMDALKVAVFGSTAEVGPLGPLSFRDHGKNAFHKGHCKLGPHRADLVVWAPAGGPSTEQIATVQRVTLAFATHRATVIRRLKGEGDAKYTCEEALEVDDVEEMYVTQLAVHDPAQTPDAWGLTFCLDMPTEDDGYWVIYASFVGVKLTTLDSRAD